jgi:hypothetical protein
VYGTAPKTTLEPLVKLQKRMVRLLDWAKWDEHSVPLLKKHKMVHINDLYQYKLLRTIHITGKMMDSFLPLCLLTVRENLQSTRNQSIYDLPFKRCEYSRQSIQYKAPMYINNAIDAFNNSTSAADLKKKLKGLYINRL